MQVKALISEFARAILFPECTYASVLEVALVALLALPLEVVGTYFWSRWKRTTSSAIAPFLALRRGRATPSFTPAFFE